ncbi:MAG: flagellar protein FlgN [Caldicoprobacterales bacterium]|jgi:Mg2+ and Co2+ transporter CorA|nr:flagellar protein FlgN [Clostridiales bacterium]
MVEILMGILSSMEKERDFYLELNELSTRKTDIIIEKKIKDLEKIVDLEQGIIVNIGKLEADRQELVDRLAGIKDVDPESITLSTLIEYSDGDIRDRFQTLQDDFVRIIDRQSHLNEINEKLIRTNLEYINMAINLMVGDGTSGQVYQREGRTKKGGQNRNLFDSKA